MLSMRWYRKPYVRITSHVIFWFIYLAVNVLTVKKFYPDEAFLRMMLRFGLSLPVDVTATYLTVYGLFPWFLFRRRYLMFTVSFLLGAFFFIVLQRIIVFYIVQPVFFPATPPTYPFWQINWFYSFTNIYLVVGFVSVVKLLEISFEQQRNTRELDREKIEAELKFLKAQVHPHFLFNTLNNLYALTLDKSDKAPEVVLKLSELLNYMLYECNEPYMLISKEIQLIENYLELERIRYGDQLKLDFSVSGDTAGKKIAPMLLLPFVENSFKHGVSKVRKDAFVRISLDVNEHDLNFKVSNSRPIQPENDLGDYSEGIGLKNVKRRLELIYPGKYKLGLEQQENEFDILLNIKLVISYDSQMSVGR